MDKSQYIPMLPENSLTLVLGGSGGIGSEVVRALAANGGDVVIGYGRNKAEAEVLRAEAEELGVKALIAQIDRTSREAMDTTLESIVAEAGREITGVVDCIGISPNIPFHKLTLEDFRKVFQVNVDGCFVSTQSIAERLKSKGVKNATFVIITSTNGDNSFSAQSLAYDMSKRALDGLVMSLAEEYGTDDIRFIGAALGWIADKDPEGMNSSLPPGMWEREIGFVYMARPASPIEAARFIYTLMTSAYSYVTGEIIKMDGGYPRRNPVSSR